MEIPDPRYVKTADGAYIAYQVVGDGPIDIAWQFDFGGNIDVWWESAWDRAWFEEIAAFGRLILHDWRGTGLSSRDVALPILETRAADLLSVLDAAGSERAVLGGWYESVAPCLLLAAGDPDRVRALVWWGPTPRTTWAPDYPRGHAFENAQGFRPPEEVVRWIAKIRRNTCTPDVAIELNKIWWQTDIRGILPSVQVPTLLLVDDGERDSPAIAEHVASLMPHAVVETFPGGVWPDWWSITS
jgi:pimeloyl-ACP methyl ester carboxylesterase